MERPPLVPQQPTTAAGEQSGEHAGTVPLRMQNMVYGFSETIAKTLGKAGAD